MGETRGKNLYKGSGRFGTGSSNFLHAETMLHQKKIQQIEVMR
jgi:hypothetical protein